MGSLAVGHPRNPVFLSVVSCPRCPQAASAQEGPPDSRSLTVLRATSSSGNSPRAAVRSSLCNDSFPTSAAGPSPHRTL